MVKVTAWHLAFLQTVRSGGPPTLVTTVDEAGVVSHVPTMVPVLETSSTPAGKGSAVFTANLTEPVPSALRRPRERVHEEPALGDVHCHLPSLFAASNEVCAGTVSCREAESSLRLVAVLL